MKWRGSKAQLLEKFLSSCPPSENVLACPGPSCPPFTVTSDVRMRVLVSLTSPGAAGISVTPRGVPATLELPARVSLWAVFSARIAPKCLSLVLSASSRRLPVSETAVPNPRLPQPVPALRHGEHQTDNPQRLHYLTADAGEPAPGRGQRPLPAGAAAGPPVPGHQGCVSFPSRFPRCVRCTEYRGVFAE